MTINQLIRSNGRVHKKHLCRVSALNKCPHKLGIIKRLYTTSPKKPHSAVRKVAKVMLRSFGNKEIIVAIPGFGNKLQKFSRVTVRGGRVRDIPGVHYKAICGARDFSLVEIIKVEPLKRGRRLSVFCMSAKNYYSRKLSNRAVVLKKN